MSAAEQLLATLAARVGEYAWAEVALASQKAGDSLEFIRGRVEFFRDAPSDRNAVLDFGPLLLERAVFPAVSVSEKLAQAANYDRVGKRQTGQPWRGRVGTLRSEVTISSVDRPSWLYNLRAGFPNAIGEPRHSGWPADEFWGAHPSVNTAVDVPAPIVDVRLGLVADPASYIDDFVGASLWKWPGHGRGLLVLLPDYRARLTQAVVSGDSLTTHFEVGLASPDRLRFRASVDGKEIHPPPRVDLAGGTVVSDIPNATQSIQLMMLDSSKNDLIDWVYIRAGFPAVPEVVNLVPRGQLSWLVSQGESDTLELKELPNEGQTKRRSSDMKKIVETVVAFANSKGGVVVVGVSDERIAVGVDQAAARHSIEQALRARCDPPVSVEFELDVFDGMEVLIIRVPKGLTPPYTTRESGTVHIRVGASNFRATSEEIAQLVRQRDSRS